MFGCAMYSDEAKPISATEIMGIKGKPFVGKTYYAKCEGNSRATKEDVWKCVLKKASEQTKTAGYEYFTILERDAYVATKKGGSEKVKLSTTAPVKHKYEKRKNTYTTVFLVLDETQLSPWKNIYNVNDYLGEEN